MSDAQLLFLHALTGLHPGSGTALGVVDLPVSRERHTRWPLIPGSSLKGVLRAACSDKLDATEVAAIFGPGTANASDFAGAVSLTDARLLAFPVRSLRGVFAWVTCPAVLERLERDARLLGGLDAAVTSPRAERGEVRCSAKSDLLVADERLILEEFEYRRTGDASGAAHWIADRAVADPATRERLRRNLVVLHDDDFTYFARHATEVLARVGLDYETKTVRRGALFYEEFLPPETLFYAGVLATDSRSREVELGAAGVLDLLTRSVPNVLQVGGDQTIGKGLCAVRFSNGAEQPNEEAGT
jgi:CRISPR-associated protein Cmr4